MDSSACSSVREISGSPSRASLVSTAIRQAELAGYLRPVKIKHRQFPEAEERFRSVPFRLHRRFSPRFHFSFRGAYEVVALNPSDLAALCFPQNAQATRDWAESMIGKAPTSRAQLELPIVTGLEDD